MRQLVILIILALVVQSDGFGQSSENQGVFAFAYNKSGTFATENRIPEYKYARAKNVFDQLVEAKGVKNMRKPDFVMENAERRPAWTKPGEAIVVLEEKAYDLCMKTGKDSLNALAALLSHELIHYYEKHDWQKGFTQFTILPGSTDAKMSNDNDLELEFQADYMGGLLAHMAGYNTLGVMPALLSKIYEGYNLSALQEGTHPSLESRRSIAQKSDILLTKYSRVFDMSLYLTAIGNYEMARQYLDFLLINTQFQSREIYNNLGVLSLLASLNYFDAEELKYYLPIELELTTRMSTRSGEDKKRNTLIADAAYNFKNAAILDETFGPAYINLASTYLLQNELFDAEYFAKKGLQTCIKSRNSNGISNSKVILGIIEAKKGNTSQSRSLFIEANSELGRRNLCVLEQHEECVPSITPVLEYRNELVDEVNLDQLYARIMQDKEQALLSVDLDLYSSFHTIAKPSSEILLNINSQNVGEYVFFQKVSDHKISYQGVIKNGIDYQSVFDYLGHPTGEFCGQELCILEYRDRNLLLILDHDRKVKEWILYKSKY